MSGRGRPVVVFGTGAMAMLFGARLSRAGVEVTLVGSWESGLAVMGRAGIRVCEPSGCWIGPVEALSISALSRRRWAERPLTLILVKSHQTETIAPQAARIGGPILTLQNGLGNAGSLAQAAGRERVVAGVTTQGATLLGPGEVRDAGGGPTVLPQSASAWFDLLEAAGFDCRASSDMSAEIWMKAAINCAINPVTALHGVLNGAILGSSGLRELAVESASEAGRVARALGIALNRDPARACLDVARRTAANRSSMLQDLERGRPTEIDALCGEIVRLGAGVGVATPVNADLWQRVLRREPGETPASAGQAGPRRGAIAI